MLDHAYLEETLYDLLKAKKAKMCYFRAFGCKFFTYNDGKERTSESLMQRLIKGSVLDIPNKAKHIEYAIREP